MIVQFSQRVARMKKERQVARDVDVILIPYALWLVPWRTVCARHGDITTMKGKSTASDAIGVD
jgi:hypothetical protein